MKNKYMNEEELNVSVGDYVESRTEQNTRECYNEKTHEFDWEEYQHLCDCADYWDCEE